MLGNLIHVVAYGIMVVTNQQSFQYQQSAVLHTSKFNDSTLQNSIKNHSLPECNCPTNNAPVSGTDGITYANECELKCEQKNNPDLQIDHQGQWSVNSDVPPKHFHKPKSVLELIQMALELGAPFTKAVLTRLNLSVWGNGRAARTTDAVLFNKSQRNFTLESSLCKHGAWSNDLFPQDVIFQKTSSVFGMESHGIMTGLECNVKYRAEDGAYFELFVKNPYIGKNNIHHSSSNHLSIIGTRGSGYNNHVRWIIQDK